MKIPFCLFWLLGIGGLGCQQSVNTRSPHRDQYPEQQIEKPDVQPNNLTEFHFVQLHMAMPVRITVWSDDKQKAHNAGRAAYRRIDELVSILSDYDAKSEVNQLLGNEKKTWTNKPQTVSPDLMAVIRYAKEIHQITDGAFDPSAGPVIRLWRKARKVKKLPSEQEIQNALEKVGFDQIEIDPESNRVTVKRPGIRLDFGAIGKGYICDQALEVLKKHGLPIACIDAGGELRVGDAPPHTDGWEAQVPHVGKLFLKNCALSVSGDTEQFVVIDGVTYSHVVDPRTGMALTDRIMTVVIAPTAMESDALATGASVMDEKSVKKRVSELRNIRLWRWPVDHPERGISIFSPESE